MVAVENSENALLVENDMRDNKQQRDSRCAGESCSRRNYINSVSFFFLDVCTGGEKRFRFSRGKAGFHR